MNIVMLLARRTRRCRHIVLYGRMTGTFYCVHSAIMAVSKVKFKCSNASTCLQLLLSFEVPGVAPDVERKGSQRHIF